MTFRNFYNKTIKESETLIGQGKYFNTYEGNSDEDMSDTVIKYLLSKLKNISL